jgi:hypothetical protein
MATDTLNRRNQLWAETHRQAEPIARKEQEVRNSPRWNSYEKADKLVTLSREVEPLVEQVQKEHRATSERLGRLRERLNTVPRPEGDAVARAVRNAEIRSVLRQMPIPERSQVFLRAAQDGRAELLHTILDSPLELVAADIVKQGLAVYHEKYSPDVWENAQQAELMAEQVESLTEHLGMWVASLREGAGLEAKAAVPVGQ